MYLGHIVELGTGDEVYSNPQHPYTIALLSASPFPDPDLERTRKRIILTGDVPSPVNPPSGCPFHPRCWKAQAICREVTPRWKRNVPAIWPRATSPGRRDSSIPSGCADAHASNHVLHSPILRTAEWGICAR